VKEITSESCASHTRGMHSRLVAVVRDKGGSIKLLKDWLPFEERLPSCFDYYLPHGVIVFNC